MAETKGHYISFRVGDGYFRRIKELGDKLGLDRSQTIRLMIDKGLEQYLNVKSPLLVVDNEKWNAALGVQLEEFIEKVRQVTELANILTKQAKKSDYNGNSIDVTEADLAKWIDLAIKDDRNFNTKDANPEVEKAKTMILTIIRKMKGRVD